MVRAVDEGSRVGIIFIKPHCQRMQACIRAHFSCFGWRDLHHRGGRWCSTGQHHPLGHFFLFPPSGDGLDNSHCGDLGRGNLHHKRPLRCKQATRPRSRQRRVPPTRPKQGRVVRTGSSLAIRCFRAVFLSFGVIAIEGRGLASWGEAARDFSL